MNYLVAFPKFNTVRALMRQSFTEQNIPSLERFVSAKEFNESQQQQNVRQSYKMP